MGNMEHPTEQVVPEPEFRPKPVQEMNLKEILQEHGEMVYLLPEIVRSTTRKMDLMRQSGIPDRAAYDKLRRDLIELYDRFGEVNQRLIDFNEEIEDGYRLALEKDTEWHKRDSDRIPEAARKEPLELYDEAVVKLLADTITVEEDADARERAGTLDAPAREELREKLADLYEKLDALDQGAESGVSEQSRERTSLVRLMQKLNRRFRQERASAGALSAARATYRRVKAEYASVQHTLTEAQRQAMRTTIARMTSAVRQAEDDAWQGMFARAPLPALPPLMGAPRRSTEEVHSEVRRAVARASAQAPTLAAAVLARPADSGRRGIFAAIGEAMKLR